MLVMGTAAWFILDMLQLNSWLAFFSAAAVYTVIYIALAYLFMMDGYERNLVQEPVKKILRKLKLLK